MKFKFRISLLIILLLFLIPFASYSQVSSSAVSSNASSSSTYSTETTPTVQSNFGITYFLFFNGPGLDPSRREAPPNQLGSPDDDGLSMFNVISLRYKFNKNLALDFQTRGELFFNERSGMPEDKFKTYRWESPRVGVSGKLASGNDWSITGAINTDLPYFLPQPLTGYTSQGRTVIANPGVFANFSYKPSSSRFSVFGILSPRLFIYGDNEAITVQDSEGGFNWRNKPQLVLSFSPTVNYYLTEKLSFSLGTTIDYRKQVGSKWSPLDASLKSNGNSDSWRFIAMPASAGITYEASTALRIFPYVQAFPIAAQRINARTGRQATLLESASIGMWVNGTVF